jgi:site-specific DNA recombinase
MSTSRATSTRAIIYLRVSTASQVKHGTSLDEQRRELLAYAERTGLEVVDVIEDAAESGANRDRPGIRRALDMIEAGDAEVFVATRIDRVARDLRDLLNFAHELKEAGASMLLADGSFDTSTPQGKLQAQIMGAFAEWDRAIINDRLKAGREAARAKGVRFGRPPVGMTAKRGVLAPADRERVQLARRAGTLKKKGATLQAIADTFNREGIATGSNRPGTRWHPSSISRLLTTARALDATS